MGKWNFTFSKREICQKHNSQVTMILYPMRSNIDNFADNKPGIFGNNKLALVGWHIYCQLEISPEMQCQILRSKARTSQPCTLDQEINQKENDLIDIILQTEGSGILNQN